MFRGGEHYTHLVSTFPLKNKVANIEGLIDFPEQEDCIIEDDVWIGNGAIIRQGVRVGSGAVIASGAVVTRDVKPYSIVAGVPARVIRSRFEEKEVQKLLSIKWWDWDIDRIRNAVLNNEFDDIKSFTRRYEE